LDTERSISVLVPVRNAESTIKQTASDLLSGMEVNDELLLIDDGSTDQSAVLLAQLARDDSRVRIESTSGLGLAGALNLGLRLATNNWIARADADDRYPASRLVHQRRRIRDGTVLVGCDYEAVAGGRVVGQFPSAITHPFVVASLVNPQRVPHPGVLYDRQAVWEAGGYVEAEFPAEDLGLWLRMSWLGEFVAVPQVCLRWTMAARSVTHSNQYLQRAKTHELLETFFPRRLVTSSLEEQLDVELAAIEGARLPGLRRILLLRDLLALREATNDLALVKESLLSVARHPIQSAQAGVEALKDSRIRSSLRRAHEDDS
jgi:glycosyltransferase involved in cell wall biosynthesis